MTTQSIPIKIDIQQRIADLRAALAEQDLTAIIIPTADPHLSEYLPKYWQTREWLSGFTGSAGTLVITADFAGLWADSRYWVQAADELADTINGKTLSEKEEYYRLFQEQAEV